MEPEDTRRVSQEIKMTIRMPSSFSSESSDNLRSVQEIQTDRRRKKRGISIMEEHECSSSVFFGRRRMCPSSNLSFSSSLSSSSLVLFLFTSALLLLVCFVPSSQSLPFEGRSLSSSSNNNEGGVSRSHRSHMDLLIDPIHQAEYGDDDPFENTRVVKSVFDMVLRTPPPPTRSTNNCPPGTQSPFEGGPCIKKSTDPVATVDQSFLLDTLRDLAKDGMLFGQPSQKNRRPGGSPGGNRRRTSGRRTTTTIAPSTTMDSSEEGAELEGEISPTTTDKNTGDNINVNMAVAEVQEVEVTEDPSTSPGTTLSVANGETPEVNDGLLSSSSSVDQIDSDTMAPAETTAETVTTTVPTTTTETETSPVKDGADLRRTAEQAQQAETVPSSSSAETGNEEQKVVMDAAATATTPTTFIIETQAMATTEQQVKSGQVQREEPVPTIIMMTTSTTSSTTTPSQLDQSGANNSSDAGGSSHLSSHDHVVQTSDQGDSQISPESQINNQDDHQGSFPNHPVSLPSPTLSSSVPPPSSVIATAATPTQPTFPKEEILTTVDDVTYQTQADKDRHHHDHVVSPNGTANTNSASFSATNSNLSFSEPHLMRTSPTDKSLKVIETVGAENQVVTGVIFHPHQHPLEQKETEQPDAQFKIENVSLANSAEMKGQVAEHELVENLKENEDLSEKMMMTTRMIKVLTGETPQIRQDDESNSYFSLATLPPPMMALFADSQVPQHQQPKEIPSEEPSLTTIAFERESSTAAEPNDRDGFTAATLMPARPEEEESNKKVLSDAITTGTGEGTSATILLNNEKVPRPLGPLEKTTIELQEQVQHTKQDDAAEVVGEIAGDMSVTGTKDGQQQQVEVTEADDGQESSGNVDAVVNHSKEDAEDDKGKQVATPQVENGDLAITANNGNLPASVSLVHDDDIRQQTEYNDEMPIVDDVEVADMPVVNKDGGGDEKISFDDEDLTASGKQEQTEKISFEEQGNNEETVLNENKDGSSSSLETVPPAATTNAPPTGSYPLHKFQPSDSLLQFQLPIVTKVPSAPPARQQDNVHHDESNSFQPFPEFSISTNPGKVRFPNSAEEDDNNKGQTELKPPVPFKPIFVKDFHLDYPSRHIEAPPPPSQQQWQIPKPFASVESKEAPNHQPSPALPEYYDTGSTEYLESELDRHHQKTRSRNRIRNSPEPNIPTTTNQPLLPPELSFYTAPQQQQQHQQQQLSPASKQQDQHHRHDQPSLYFARRNPSEDLIPFGYLNFRTGHDRFNHNTRRLIW